MSPPPRSRLATLAAGCLAAGCLAVTAGCSGPASTPATVTGTAPPVSVTATTPRPGTQLTSVYVTGYSWFDNTPPGSTAISHPVVHRTAGGAGSYADPVTVAVGHSLAGGTDLLDLPAGTRLYLPHLRRYGVVEDTCGNGPRPQDGPCHNLRTAPAGTRLWIDVYLGGGAGDSQDAVRACAGVVTDGGGQALRSVIVGPAAGLPVVAGPIFSNGHCALG
jgi:hypothetical protein